MVKDISLTLFLLNSYHLQGCVRHFQPLNIKKLVGSCIFFFQFKDIFGIFYLLFRLMLGALFYGVWWFILFAEPLNLLNMCIQLSDLDINIFDDNALGNC